MRLLYRSIVVLCVAVLGVMLCVSGPAEARRKASGSVVTKKSTAGPAPTKSQVVKKATAKQSPRAAHRKSVPESSEEREEASGLSISTVCVEEESGAELSAQNADEERPPASMVKMLLMLLVSEGIEGGKWTLDTPITVTKHAAETPPTKLGVKEGEVWPLGYLMRGMAVVSANDAAMAVAEGLWGSEDAYKKRMNERAQELGMKHSEFHSVHGLPPTNGEKPDRTTARDMALLARSCVRSPQLMQWVGTTEFQFRPNESPRPCTNKLLGRVPGCDGLKTGYTRAAGHCIAVTAVRNNIRLITVVMGCQSKLVRFNIAEELLEKGFQQVTRERVLAAGQEVLPEVKVGNCSTTSVKLTVPQDVWVVMKKDDVGRLEYRIRQDRPLRAPLRAGETLAHLDVVVGNEVLTTAPLSLKQDLAAAGWKWKLERSVVATQNAG